MTTHNLKDLLFMKRKTATAAIILLSLVIEPYFVFAQIGQDTIETDLSQSEMELMEKATSFRENREYEKAAREYKVAAKKGIPEAQYWLGRWHVWNVIKSPDAAFGIELLEKACNQGYDDAFWVLVRTLATGKNIRGQQICEKNIAKAEKLANRAAELGTPTGYQVAGEFYIYYAGKLIDLEKGLGLLRKSADQDNRVALESLGSIYSSGELVEKDTAQAISYFSRAVELGSDHAMVKLGEIYENGDGVKVDLRMAHELYTQAANQDDYFGEKALKEIEDKYGSRYFQDRPQSTGFSFRNFNWGDTKDKVISDEGTPADDEGEYIFYPAKLGTDDVQVFFRFLGDKLVEGGYLFSKDHYNKDFYTRDFDRYSELLEKKYGEPVTDDTLWGNDLYKDDRSEWGMAASLGYVMFIENWYHGETEIIHSLSGSNGDCTHMVEYNGIGTSKQVEKMEEMEVLDNL